MKALSAPSLPLILTLLLPALACAQAPVIGEDIPPFGTQTIWANHERLEEALDLLQEAGVRVGRFDLCWWNLAERASGEYRFDAPDYPGYEHWNTDRLIAEMHARDIEPYAILGYGNAMWDGETGPHSVEGRAAFARYCAAAAERYRDSVHIWEIWNESNLEEYWGRESDPEDYARLAIEAAQAIREANPDAIIVGPALSWLNIAEGMLDRWCEFLEVCGEVGLYDFVDAVSIHPYRVGIPPESIDPELARVREIIAAHTDNDVDVWFGEWGYNTIWTEVDPVEQAMYLPRQALHAMSRGVGMTIWFCVFDFEGWGVVEEDWTPRPSFAAMQTLNRVLAPPVQWVEAPFEITVNEEIEGFRAEVYDRGEEMVIAVWSQAEADSGAAPTPVDLSIERECEVVDVIDAVTGDSIPVVTEPVGGWTAVLGLPVGTGPVYIVIR